MRKKLVMVLIIMLVITSITPLALGTFVNKKQNTTARNDGNYNLIVSIKADRRVFPRIYSEGITANFIVKVKNEGPNMSDAIFVNGNITRIIGRKSGQTIPFSLAVEPLEKGISIEKLASFVCSNPEAYFGVFIIQATLDVNDNNLDDNTASFIFFVVGALMPGGF
jgi:hypothetical protein